MTPSFGARLAAEFVAGRHLCVGIDPHATLLKNWQLSDDSAGAERMGRDVVAAAAGVAACVKPQIAFFERFGSAGFTALERVLADARQAGLIVIADVKRGDIGSSFAAYADAWLQPGAPLEADAMTVHAYQGFGTLSGAFDYVQKYSKGLFVLAATSNPEAYAVQTARRDDGRMIAAAMLEEADAWNKKTHPNEIAGSIGVVLGSTLRLSDFEIDVTQQRATPALPVLAPGFGFQGAQIETAGEIFGTLKPGLIASESRSILLGGNAGLRDRVVSRATAISQALLPTLGR